MLKIDNLKPNASVFFIIICTFVELYKLLLKTLNPKTLRKMRLKLFLLSLLGTVALAQAQYTVTDRAGNVLHDGDVLEFGTLGPDPAASYDFYVTNDNPSEEIYTRIEFVDAINADGSMFELCYGQCYTGITIGQTVPPAPEVLAIGVGETTLEGNHFLNADPGNGTDNLDYIFAFHQYEADGVTEIGTPLTFTYRYNPTLAVKDNTKVDLTIQSTMVGNELVLQVNEPIDMQIYDLRGRMVKQAHFETGRQVVNTADLSSQVYLARFSNGNGASQTTKIIVR